jgi:hypothetical protein
MTTLKFKHPSVAAAAASVVAVMLAAQSASAAPEVTVQVLGSLTGNAGSYVPNLSPVSPSTTIFFEVIGQSSLAGTTNTNTGLTPDGITDSTVSLPTFSLTGASDGVFESSTVGPGFNLLSNGGTTGGNSIDIRASSAGGVADDAQQTLVSSGQYQTSGNPTDPGIGGADLMTNSGSIKLAGTGVAVQASTETSGDPLLKFNPLAFTALTWDGGALNSTSNSSWDTTGSNINFSSSAYSNSNAVIFGDVAADGATAATNTTITIAAGGVTPSSVYFINHSLSYKLQNASGTTGIAGSTGVVIGGTGGTGNAVTFSSPNTYTAGTTIYGGTLFANNASNSATGSGGVTVGAGLANYGGGKLSGNGTVSGTVFLAGSAIAKQGGLIGAGGTAAANGILTTGNQTWNGGAAYQWKISSVGTVSGGINGTPGTTNDLLVIGNSGTPLTITTTNNTTALAPFTFAPKGTLTGVGPGIYNWEIAQIGSGTSTTLNVNGVNITQNSGTNLLPLTWTSPPPNNVSFNDFALDTSGLHVNGGTPSAGSFSLFFETIGSNNDLVLQFNTTPEPGTAVLVLGAIAPMLLGRRRRNRGTPDATV